MRYGKVDATQTALVPVLRAFGASWQSTASLGKDAPDGVAGFLNVDSWVEWKTGKAEPTDGQAKWHREWRGSRVWVIRDREGVIAMLDDMRRRSRAIRRASGEMAPLGGTG